MPVDRIDPFDSVNLFSPEFRAMLNTLAAGHNALMGMDIATGLIGKVGLDGITIAALNAGSDGGSGTDGFFPVRVENDGGVEGNKTTRCTFTYTVWSLDGEELGRLMTPQRNRTTIGKYVVPSGDEFSSNIGSGYYDEGGAFVLYDANEVFATAACS